MNKIKRGLKTVICYVLVLSLILGVLPLDDLTLKVYAATSGTCGENTTWTLDDDGVLTISGNGEVTEAAWDKDKVKQVIIEDGVYYLLWTVFENSSNLTTISIPKSVYRIEELRFLTGSDKLTDVFIDDENFTFADVDGAVYGKGDGYLSYMYFCPAGKSGDYNIPGSLKIVGASAFYGCNQLTSITILNGVETIFI